MWVTDMLCLTLCCGTVRLCQAVLALAGCHHAEGKVKVSPGVCGESREG